MSCKVLNLTHASLCALDPPAQPYYIGDDWSVVLLFSDATGALDLTGKTFHSTIKDNAGTELLARKSTDTAQIEILNQGDPLTKGQLRIKIARTETVAAAKNHTIDLVQVAADLSEQTWAFGTFESKARNTPTPAP